MFRAFMFISGMFLTSSICAVEFADDEFAGAIFHVTYGMFVGSAIMLVVNSLDKKREVELEDHLIDENENRKY